MNSVHIGREQTAASVRDEDMTLAELRAIINVTSRDLTVALTRILDILDNAKEPRP